MVPAITATTVRNRKRLGISRASGGDINHWKTGTVGSDYHHVPQPGARVSGYAGAGGSIGDEECRVRGLSCGSQVVMSETDSPASPSASPEAEIAAALGRRSVVLVGMMGAGKSTIGRRLAARLRLSFVDADAEIEAAARMSIADIFESHGEPYFRDGEARVIARLLDGGPCVLATGGGAFMREDTRNRIRDQAVSIWLRADADVIMRRVMPRADPPLLPTPGPAPTTRR